MLVFLDGGDEVGSAVVVNENVAISGLDSQRSAAPVISVGTVDGVAVEAANYTVTATDLDDDCDFEIANEKTRETEKNKEKYREILLYLKKF